MSERRREDREREYQEQSLRRIREETSEEREIRGSVVRALAGYLGFADVMAVLMVAATALTAVATWRTATIAHDLLLTSERPYFGVHSVKLDRSLPKDPRIYVDFRDFGKIPADDVLVRVAIYINGTRERANSVIRKAGIMSPKVAHHLYLHIPNAHYADVIAGRAKLLTEVSAWYRSSGRTLFCYRERFAYKPGSGTFEIAGGSSRCDSPPPF